MSAIHDELPPVICISLPGQSERRARMRAQFDAAGIPLKFFDAIRIAGDVGSYPPNYAARQRLRRYAMHLCAGEVGCYMSHREVWRQLAASDDAAWCVLEDDVILGDRFAQTLGALYRLRSEWDVVRLVQSQQQDFRVLKPLHEAAQLVAFTKQPTGAVGYLITREAARVLYPYSECILRPIDDMMDRHWEHRLRMRGVFPDAIKHDWDSPTTIAGRGKAKRSFTQKLVHNFYTGRDSLARHWYNFTRDY